MPWHETRRDQTFGGLVLPSTHASRPSIRQPCQIQWQGGSDVHKERGQNQTPIADWTSRFLPTIQVEATCCYGRQLSFTEIKPTGIENIEIGTQSHPVIFSAGCPSSLWEQFCWSRLGWGPAWSSPMQASSTCAGYFSRCVQWLQQAHQELLGRRHALFGFEFVKPPHVKEMVTWIALLAPLDMWGRRLRKSGVDGAFALLRLDFGMWTLLWGKLMTLRDVSHKLNMTNIDYKAIAQWFVSSWPKEESCTPWMPQGRCCEAHHGSAVLGISNWVILMPKSCKINGGVAVCRYLACLNHCKWRFLHMAPVCQGTVWLSNMGRHELVEAAGTKISRDL